MRDAWEESLPARGAWIEMGTVDEFLEAVQSLPARGAWIEIEYFPMVDRMEDVSLPARGAWIEIRFR